MGRRLSLHTAVFHGQSLVPAPNECPPVAYDNSMLAHIVTRKNCVCMYRLMLRCGMKRGRIKDDAEVKLLQQFWASCSDVNFQPPLGPQEATMLQQLASIR